MLERQNWDLGDLGTLIWDRRIGTFESGAAVDGPGLLLGLCQRCWAALDAFGRGAFGISVDGRGGLSVVVSF